MVGAGLLVMGVGALIGALLLGASGAGGGLFRVVGSLVLLAVGGKVTFGGNDGGLTVSAMPLTLTLLGYGVMVFVFLRRLRTAPVEVARLQALRMVLVQVVAVLALGVLVSGTFTVGSSGSVHVRADLVLTEVYSACWLAALLLAAAFVYRPGWLPARVQAARAQVVGLLCGLLLAFMAALVLAALVVVIVGVAVGHASYGLAAVVLVLPNLAVAGVTAGLGAPLHASGSVGIAGFGGSRAADVTLSDLASASWWFWLLPVYAGACLLVAGLVAARLSPDLVTARRDCLRMALAVPMVLLVLSWLVAVSASASTTALFVGVTGVADVHPSYWWVLLLAAFGGALAGSAAFLGAPRLPAPVTQSLTRFVMHLQVAGAEQAAVVAGQPAAAMRLGRRGKNALVSGAVVVVLLIAASVLDQHLANSYSPRQAVDSYLNDLQNKDATAALGLLQPAPVPSDLLTGATLAKAATGGQVHNIRLGTVSRRGDVATVEATVDVGAETGVQETFQLVADHKHQHLGRYPSWRITNPLPVLQIQAAPLLSSVKVNGVSEPLASGNASIPVLPGSYTITGPDSGLLTTTAQTVIVTGADAYAGTPVQVQAQLSGQAVSDVQAGVDAKIAACATATNLSPSGCPFSDYVYGSVSQVVWTAPAPGAATQVQLDYSGAITFSGNATATVTYLLDPGFGATASHPTDPVDYSYSGTAIVSAGAVQITFS